MGSSCPVSRGRYTPFPSGEPLLYSIENGASVGDVVAAERMQSGCMVTFPRAMEEECDFAKSNMIIESWSANSYRLK